jgi:hypothetical protein
MGLEPSVRAVDDSTRLSAATVISAFQYFIFILLNVEYLLHISYIESGYCKRECTLFSHFPTIDLIVLTFIYVLFVFNAV